MLPRYDILQTYDWNYAHAPEPPEGIDVPVVAGEWDFCGLPVASPLGIPAGPLLNGKWIRYYAALGFDVLTYKTVRSRARACYDLPNLLPVTGDLRRNGGSVRAAAESESWAISFGMPSKEPRHWQDDVSDTRRALAAGQVLAVSVVASPDEGWTLRDIEEDFARLAVWARDAGAQAVEANLSCPNVCSQEGQLYTSAEAVAAIAGRMRQELGPLPLILKIGQFDDEAQAEAALESAAGQATAVSTTNSLTARVDGQFGGLTRGVGGAAIREGCQAELAMLHAILVRRGWDLKLIGVGGISTAGDVRARLSAGAHHVQIATAAMLDPLVGVRIRAAL